MRKERKEDDLTLISHTKWVYAIYYSSDGKWLFSTGEDNKVIAWKTTMWDLYKALGERTYAANKN